MFTSLHIAKRVGAIHFEWGHECVIVFGLRSLLGELTPLGVHIALPNRSNAQRSAIEMNLAHKLGIVKSPSWVPEEF